MVTDSGRALTFGTLLRRHRRAAGLTQEALAQHASVSVRTISDLERGVRDAPHKDTVVLLANALRLPDAERAAFLRAADRLRARAPASAPPHTSPGGTGSTAPPFVGRQRERALLERHLAGEGPPVLLLAGEPGIGKSRLLVEATVHAHAQGWQVLQGGCQRRGGQEPYAPLLEALQRHLREQRPGDLRAHLRGCAWLVRLLPELADGPIEPLPRWTLTPEQERRLMVAAVLRFLGNVAGPAGTLLVLDDLQWAGAEALDLLGTLLRSAAAAPVRVLGAYRDTEVQPPDPLSAFLADLAAADGAGQVALGPLAPPEAATLLDALLAEVDQEGRGAREQVLQRSGGVPFFLVSCARGLRARTPADRAEARLPWNLTQSVRQRVMALPETAREVLRRAAVVGRVAERAVLVAMSLQPRDVVLDALDAACKARLLEEEGPSAYRFAHDLVREVVEADLSAARRTALHQRAGEALEAMGSSTPVAVLAYHYARSDAVDKAILYLERAGDQALAQLASGDAEGSYRELVRLLEPLERRYDAARIYAKLGLQLLRTGRSIDSLVALQQVVEAYSGSTTAMPRELSTGAATENDDYRSEGDGAASINTVLALMEEHESEHTRGVLYLAYACYCWATNRGHDNLIVTARAVELARRLHDDLLLAEALEAQSMALFVTGRREEAFDATHEALDLYNVHGDRVLLSEVLVDLVFAHVQRGEFVQGDRYNDQTLQIAEAVGDTYSAAWAHERRAWIAKFTGDWEHAQADLARALQLAPDVAHDPWFACMRGELCLVQGAWDDAAAHFEQSIIEAASFGLVPAQVCTQSFLAELDLLQGRPASALARTQAALAQDVGEYTPILLTWAALGHLQLVLQPHFCAASGTAAMCKRELHLMLASPMLLR